MDFRSFCMLETESLRTALAHLNQAAKKVLFLTDAAGHLTAALTDGDVRRCLLSGGTLEDSAANAGNRHPIAARSREEALRLLARHGCVAVPVLGRGWVRHGCCAGGGAPDGTLHRPRHPRSHHGGRQGHAP